MGLLRWRKSSDDSGHSFGGYPTGDIGRIETQQAFMTAVIEKCLQPTVLLPNLLEYLQIFQKNMETDLSISNMAYFVKAAVGKMSMENVVFITMPYKSAGDGAHLLPVASEMVEVVNESFNPYLDDIKLSDLDIVTSVSSGNSSSGSGSGQSSKPSASPEPSETAEPTAEPTTEPTTEPTAEPTTEPTGEPTTEPSASPSPSPSPGQSVSPSPSPSAGQTTPPSTSPSTSPSTTTPAPSTTPTPSATPTPPPIVSADPVPTSGPGMEPTE